MLWVSIEHSIKSFYKQRNIILYIYIYTVNSKKVDFRSYVFMHLEH